MFFKKPAHFSCPRFLNPAHFACPRFLGLAFVVPGTLIPSLRAEEHDLISLNGPQARATRGPGTFSYFAKYLIYIFLFHLIVEN